jgi:cell division protein FtsN
MVAAEEQGPGSAPPRAAKGRAATEAADTGEDAPATQYDFYDMLPKFEVVVPERDQEVKRDAPRSPIERPGVYVLQAGSYRKLEDAQRVQNQLLKLGVEANLQRVAVDADEWHRVRIGPLTDLDEVNRLRTRLRASGLEPLVIRVGD